MSNALKRAEAAEMHEKPEAIQDCESVPVDAAQLALVEALLFASSDPLAADTIGSLASLSRGQVQFALTSLQERYASELSGVELVGVAGKFQLRTKPVFGKYVRELRAGAPRRLSPAALETVAIIAYRQPITRADMERLRGVDVTPTLKTLLDRGLIRIVGHQSSIGQPALYGTTEEFLKLFGLDSLAELPTLRDLREFEREPGEEAGDSEVAEEPSGLAEGTHTNAN